MIKHYVFEVEEIDGKLNFKGYCNGFNAAELVGFLAWKQDDIIRQMRGEIKAERVFVENKPQEVTE